MKPFKKLIGSSSVTLFLLAILLISAGRLNYWQAWLYTAISVLMNIATLIVLRDKPDLLEERAKPGIGAQKWDKAILGIGLLLTIATQIVAGLDTGRYHWSPEYSWTWVLLGAALNILGMALFLYAMRENTFFSPVARIQEDRKHTVCKTGPYRFVRHPGYAGMIIGTIGFPFLFLSVWSCIPVALSVVNLVVRTALEDRFLESQLKGYRDYKQTTRFRLIPGLW